MNARGVDFTGIAYIGALIVGAVVVYKVVKGGAGVAAGVQSAVSGAVSTVKEAAGAAVDAVTPTNPNNIFNRLFQPVADALIKGGSPDAATRSGSKLLHTFTAADQDDADMGAAMRTLQRRPDYLLTALDLEDAEIGAAMSAANGESFMSYEKLRRGAIK